MNKYEILLMLQEVGLIDIQAERPIYIPFASHYEYHYFEDGPLEGVYVRRLN